MCTVKTTAQDIRSNYTYTYINSSAQNNLSTILRMARRRLTVPLASVSKTTPKTQAAAVIAPSNRSLAVTEGLETSGVVDIFG